MNQLTILQSQKHPPQQTVIHETVVQQPQKSKVIDRQRLHDLLSHKWNRIVDEVIDRRKQACLGQVGKVVESCKVTIRIHGEGAEREVMGGGYYAAWLYELGNGLIKWMSDCLWIFLHYLLVI